MPRAVRDPLGRRRSLIGEHLFQGAKQVLSRGLHLGHAEVPESDSLQEIGSSSTQAAVPTPRAYESQIPEPESLQETGSTGTPAAMPRSRAYESQVPESASLQQTGSTDTPAAMPRPRAYGSQVPESASLQDVGFTGTPAATPRPRPFERTHEFINATESRVAQRLAAAAQKVRNVLPASNAALEQQKILQQQDSQQSAQTIQQESARIMALQAQVNALAPVSVLSLLAS